MNIRATHGYRLDASLAPRSTRWLTLDVFRGLAILSMIQGHTFTVLLKPSEYGETWLPWYTLLHGLTAPMFLLGGGLAYGIVTLRDAPSGRWGNANARIVQRALMLLALGYLLQLPKAPISELWVRPDLLACAARVGPLQLVASCLLLCEVVRTLARTQRAFLVALVSLTFAVCGCAPFVWQAKLSTVISVPIGTWFDGYAGSLFPFFPWAGFFLIGVLISLLPRQARQRGRERERFAGGALMLVGAATAALAYGMFVHGFVLRSLYGQYELWHTSPLYVAFRVAASVVALGGLWLMEPLVQRLWRRVTSLERIFGVLSRQSLVAYVTHLLILYGTPFTAGLIRLGTTLSLLEASVTFLFVLCLTTAISVLWDHFVTSGVLRQRLSSLARGAVATTMPRVDGIGER